MKKKLCIALSLTVFLLSGCAEKQMPSEHSLTEKPAAVAPSASPDGNEKTVLAEPTDEATTFPRLVINPMATDPQSVTQEAVLPTEINREQKDHEITLEVIPQFPPDTEPTKPTEPEIMAEVPESHEPQVEPTFSETDAEAESIVIDSLIPTLSDTLSAEPTIEPDEPVECSHDWNCVYHSEVGHWLAGVVCDCGWSVYGEPTELVAAWNAHSAAFPPEESLFEHGGFRSADEWVVDTPAREEWLCNLCGEQKK